MKGGQGWFSTPRLEFIRVCLWSGVTFLEGRGHHLEVHRIDLSILVLLVLGWILAIQITKPPFKACLNQQRNRIVHINCEVKGSDLVWT